MLIILSDSRLPSPRGRRSSWFFPKTFFESVEAKSDEMFRKFETLNSLILSISVLFGKISCSEMWDFWELFGSISYWKSH